MSDPFSVGIERRERSLSALSASGPGPLPGPGPPWQRRAALPQLPGLPSTPAPLPTLDLVTLDEEWKSLLSFSRMHPVGAALPAQVWGGPLPFSRASLLLSGACGTQRHSKACLSFSLVSILIPISVGLHLKQESGRGQ